MVLWLGFNLAETTSAWPPQGGVQAEQKPNSAKSPTVGAEHKENPAQGKSQEAQHAGNKDSKKWSQQKAHLAQSLIPADLQKR